ncbi:hypothetical protein AJ78_02381 [Emergomyces pasteurianus Ep9510]|uniref:Uncharacterized protein n=1 Tax=Emergomyces pasteurianus Ep9510 TaxID=1447872 RepID=A0A1J9PLX3_9EURO|nr:hypothetical protein AJ78_02381 [Emergomyces pasteurianus Ep9510]
MVDFHIPNILHRKVRPQATGHSSSPHAEMTDSDKTPQGSQQADSCNIPSLNDRNSSWSSRYFPSALASRYGASKSSSSATGNQVNNASYGSENNNNNNYYNYISRLPASVKRKSSDSASRTPTRNTEIPIPTIIHPSTSLTPSSSFSPSHSAPARTKHHSTRHHSQRKSILKVSTATPVGDDDELYHHHTSQSDTRANTSRNALLTLSYTSSPDDTNQGTVDPRPWSLSTQQCCDSLPPTMMPLDPQLATNGGNIIHPSLGSRETEPEPEEPYDCGAGEEKAKAQARKSSRSSSYRSNRNKQKNTMKKQNGTNTKKNKKMVRFDHIDIHTYEVERREESRFCFFGGRGEGTAEGTGNANANGPSGIGNRGGDVEFDLDLREYVMDIPDVIQG